MRGEKKENQKLCQVESEVHLNSTTDEHIVVLLLTTVISFVFGRVERTLGVVNTATTISH